MRRAAVGGEEGQMVVEMAVAMPVMLVVAVIVLNVGLYVEASARFDRVALDAVLSQAVSPAGETAGSANEHGVAEAIERGMGGVRGVSVTVRAETVWDDLASGAGVSFAPHLTRYVCAMSYAPWPASFSIAGVDAAVPVELSHVRELVVDRYRPGVVF